MELRAPIRRYIPQRHLTELGDLPVDWLVVPIDKFRPFVTSGSRGWAAYYAESGATFLRITNLSRSRIYPSLDDLKYVAVPADNSEGIRTALQVGDVLISITADIGIIGLVTPVIELPAFINQHIALVRFDSEQVDSRYLAYFLAGKGSQRRFKAMTDAGAKAGMNLTGVRQVLAALPPTTSEQTSIAQALSDADALIESVSRLLKKKREIKQGAMQELLTGKSRLPAFERPWVRRALADVAWMKSGQGITAESISESGSFPCYGGNGLRGHTSSFTHAGSYALIGRQGALCGNVTLASGKFFASEHAVVVTPKHGTDVVWLYHLLGRMELNRYSESSAQPGLSVAKILELTIQVPDRQEQKAIAQILSDMDADIAAAEARLGKVRDLKQSMMQVLLTGRIRLIPPASNGE